MKSVKLNIALLLSIFTINFSFAQNHLKKETLEVWGNCGICKKNIETVAKTAGAFTANWNQDNKKLELSFDSSKTSSVTIEQAIAKAGYDTQDFKGDDNAYGNLEHCCQYDRKKPAKEKK